MLEVFFCNVGDGDAILLREHRETAPDYTVLVDTGRPYVESAEGSLRKDALDHLLQRGVEKIDRMILTHLHIDHVGGAMRILRAIPTDRLEMLYLPPQGTRYVSRSFISVKKTVNGLKHMLNVTRELTEAAEERGVKIGTVSAGKTALTEALTVEIIPPRQELIERQKEVFDTLYGGGTVAEDLCYAVAKERNNTSLMLRFTYGGRSVLLTGDRYAADWEEEDIPPCDILKLPHHGDGKSVTEALLKKLSPRYAVISCQNDPEAKKERPAETVAALLKEHVPEVFCTENRPMRAFAGSTHNGIGFWIGEDGSLVRRYE